MEGELSPKWEEKPDISIQVTINFKKAWRNGSQNGL